MIHTISYDQDTSSHENTIRAGLNHTASCRCGWKFSKGTRTAAGRAALQHAKKNAKS